MPHPLVDQLRFTRSEFMRAVKGVTDAEARKRLLPMNCISWNIGHLAWQEQRYFLGFQGGKILFPEIERISPTVRRPAPLRSKRCSRRGRRSPPRQTRGSTR